MSQQPIVQPSPPGGIMGRLFKLPAYLYKAHLGLLFGHRFLILVHRGRRTRQRYETPLEVVRFNPETGEAIVMAG
jgi:hypothetical protein